MLFNKSLDFVLGIKHDFDFITKFTCKTICLNPIYLVIQKSTGWLAGTRQRFALAISRTRRSSSSMKPNPWPYGR
jgi:hypothetical protein